MGLAASQIRLLTLTARKADCEYGLSINAMEKMALTREQSELSREYQSKLQAKQISYYANGQYNKINYSYLMGYDSYYKAVTDGTRPIKEDNSMILTDYKGQVVLSDTYANAITSVLGSSAMNGTGQGGTFSEDKIPEILAKVIPSYTADEFRTVIDGGNVDASYTSNPQNTMTGESTGETVEVDISSETTARIQQIVDFYYPIFQAAAANGWTKEYNQEMAMNDDYISDAIVSGTFQLEIVDETGNYDPATSLTYFLTNGAVQERTDSSVREEITAWYEGEKARSSQKEDWLHMANQELSTELEAINTEIQSVESLVEDATSVLDWGSA